MGNQRRSRRSRTQKHADERAEILRGGASSRRASSSREGMDDEWQTLNAQIGALESFLHGAHARAEHQRRQRLQNILPPPDRADYPRSERRMSRWQERHHYDQRQRHGLTFLFLFCAVCGLLWWLLHASTGM